MQFQHRRFLLARNNEIGYLKCALYCLLDQNPLFLARVIQHEIDHFGTLAGMPDTQTQTPEVSGAEMRDDVFQAVMPTVSAAQLQARCAGLQIQIVMHHQNFRRLDPVELRQRADGSPADIHKGLRLEQQHFMAVQLTARGQTMKFCLVFEAQVLPACEFVHPAEADVMPGGFVFAPWVAQAGNQTYGSHGIRMKKPAMPEPAMAGFIRIYRSEERRV